MTKTSKTYCFSVDLLQMRLVANFSYHNRLNFGIWQSWTHILQQLARSEHDSWLSHIGCHREFFAFSCTYWRNGRAEVSDFSQFYDVSFLHLKGKHVVERIDDTFHVCARHWRTHRHQFADIFQLDSCVIDSLGKWFFDCRTTFEVAYFSFY